MSVDLLDRDEVRDGGDHAADLGAVLFHDDVADPLQPQASQRLALISLASDGRPRLLDLELGHHSATSARALRRAAGVTCSTVRPRCAATASGVFSIRRAATVAPTMFRAFDEPSDLLRTSWTPAHSRTARTGPPAMTPVPGAAGRSSTTPAAFSPCTGCGMVPWMRGTRNIDFFASSTPLAMAAGNSLALP